MDEAQEKQHAYEARLKNGCEKCGTTGKRYLQFHHREPRKKLFNISWGLKHESISKEMFELELEKCDVLCAVCHRREHADKRLPGPRNAKLARPREIDRLRNRLKQKG